MGLALLAASGGSTLAHRALFDAHHNGPAHAAEFALGLLTFLLASAGVLLLLHGARLFRHGSPARPASFRPGPSAGHAFDTRGDAAWMQARHAIATVRRRHDAL